MSSVTSGLWQLANLLTTPVMPAGYLDLVAPLRPGAELRARILEVRPETRDAVTLVLKPGAGWTGHRPGQYVRIGIDVDGVRRWRAYSLTSRPGEPTISITVKAIEGGMVSNHLVRRARPGQLLHLDQAAGDFTLTHARKLLFITAGSGITPIMGMLRDVFGSEPTGKPGWPSVVVVHSAPSRPDVIFGPELRHLAGQGLITLIERHTDREGLLDPADVMGLVPDLSSRETWACGPTSMLDALEAQWESWGLAGRLHTERFRPGSAVVGEGGTLRLPDGREIPADGRTPILDVAEEAGVLMRSGCRMGICFGCVIPLRSGAVRDLRDGQLTTAEEGDGVRIQPCITAAAGPCVIGPP